MDTEGLTVEQRIERLENFAAKVIAAAEAHPMGKMLLKALGL